MILLPKCPCCGCGLTGDGKPRQDPDDGETYYFYGSAQTSAPGRLATLEEIQDWGNLCNWYTAKDGPASDLSNVYTGGSGTWTAVAFPVRANELPHEAATVHVYTGVFEKNGFEATRQSCSILSFGDVTIKNLYVYGDNRLIGGTFNIAGQFYTYNQSQITADLVGNGQLFGSSRIHQKVIGNATFHENSYVFNNFPIKPALTGTFNFYDNSSNQGGIITGNTVFNNFSYNEGNIFGNVLCYDISRVGGLIKGNMKFYDQSQLFESLLLITAVEGDVEFYGSSAFRGGKIYGTATLSENSFSSRGVPFSTVNGTLLAKDNARISSTEVNGTAIISDAACITQWRFNSDVVGCGAEFSPFGNVVLSCPEGAIKFCDDPTAPCGCG
jgi:hypothetical protein